MNNRIKEAIKKAPNKAGVYIWKNKNDRILYIGKAKNLKKRLQNYLSPTDLKTKRLVETSDIIQTIITKNDVEALILEDALVKQNQPRYNVRLKDDKRYPYIKITVQEEYPNIQVTRNITIDGARYFGPYTNAGATRKIVKILIEIFGIRKCMKKLDNVKRPCINYSIGKCSGPCRIISGKEYQQHVKDGLRFLSGDITPMRKEVLAKIKEYSKKLDYEKASNLKKTLDAIDILSEKQDVSNAHLQDMDILGYALVDKRANITQMMVRNHRIVSVLHHPLKGEYMLEASKSMKAFIKQHYTTKDITPKLIITSCQPEDKELLEKTLKRLDGFRVEIQFAKRGQKRKLAEMAVENSIHQIKHEIIKKKIPDKSSSLAKALKIAKIPVRIEGYDISNIGVKHAVGSMIVFRDGKPEKSEYRRFKIRALGRLDDPKNMAEVIQRRFKHTEWISPDLIVLDGGKGQLAECVKHIPENIPVIALAKKHEEIYQKGSEKVLKLGNDHQGLHLIQEIRDEAHRFAKKYHKTRREKGFIDDG